MVLPFFFPATLILRFAGPEGAKNLAGKCPPPDSNPLETRSLEEITPTCQARNPQPRSPIRVPQTQLAFHPRAQRNAFRRRAVRPRQRLFARWNQSLRHSFGTEA